MKLPQVLVLLPLLALCALPASAQEPSTASIYFLGYESEPGMDYGGRTLASVQSGISRGFQSIFEKTTVAPAWEFASATALLLVQHEVGGHGGRGREFGLGPSYSFGWDLSGATGLARSPRTHEENALLAAGGAEADGVMAGRILLEALSPEGVDGAKIPLAMMAKLDLTMYVLGTSDPEDQEFTDEYREGNDTAYWNVTRQAQRRGASVASVFEGTYEPDRGDPLFEETWDDAQATALWNALDPSLVTAVYAYFRDHVLGGGAPVRQRMLRAGDWGFTVGTRGALGPQEVTRFLDLHGVAPWGVLTVYVRDLDSTVDRTLGYGAGVRGLRLGRSAELALEGDLWTVPDAAERIQPQGEDGWNVSAEVDAMLGERWGLAAKVGSKSAGFFPGKPLDEGVYAGFGVRAVF